MKSEVLLLLLHLLPSTFAAERDAVTIEGDRGIVIIKTDPPNKETNKVLTDLALEALKFIRQPEDMEVVENVPVKLHCTVETVTDANYVYHWYKLPESLRNIKMNEGTVISGANKAELLISSAQAHHAGQYICSVTVAQTNYTIISNTGQLKVLYYDSRTEVPAQSATRISVQKNQDYQALECGLSPSYPQVEAVWYKNGVKIADNKRMFILPRETFFSRQRLNAGALIIMYIEREDAGTYYCKTTYNDTAYMLNRYELSVDGEVQTSNTIAPSQVTTEDGESTYGGQATLYCTGIGKPPPYISWTKMDGSRVETSEKFLLSDYRRRLIITNVNNGDGTSYTCSVTVSGARTRTQIVSMQIVPSPSAHINFVTSPDSQVIYTNSYPPFSLKCSIDLSKFIGVEGSMMPVLYWLKNGNQLGFSNRRKSTTIQDTTTNDMESSIEFLAPNDSDLGVYQCIARGTTQLRQVTAYVNIRTTRSDYNINDIEPMYDVINVAMSVSAAEEHCRSWRTNGHLVSMMSRNEVETVTRLLKQEDIKQAWIGLTSERTSGHWMWTQPADDSSKFSFWADEMPDNWGGNKNYAIMDTSLGGRWLDVRNKGSEYPFVCKQYDSWCPSVRDYYENKLEPLNKVESKGTKYGVGESITVTCTDRSVAMKETLTCTTSGRYEPDEGITCPVFNNAPSSILLSSTLLVVSVVTLLIS